MLVGMQVVCPSCRARIPVEDVNVVRIVAKCRACGAVFGFDDQLDGSSKPAGAAAPTLPVVLPPDITVQQGAAPREGTYRAAGAIGELTITRRRSRAKAKGGLVFLVFWFSFLGFWFSQAAAQGAPWIFFLFPILHVSAGLWLAYRVLCDLFNRTTIRIAGGRLTVQHEPIPMRGSCDLPIEEVRQLFTEEIADSKGVKTYKVRIMTKGPTLTLAADLDRADQALYLEQIVEEHLQIPDQRLPGALAR